MTKTKTVNRMAGVQTSAVNGKEEIAQLVERQSARSGNGSEIAIRLPQLKRHQIELKLVGDSTLITHAWKDKCVQMMLGKQMGAASKGKEKKVPVEDFRSGMYLDAEGRACLPAVAFKSAAVDAAAFVDMKKTNMRGAFHVVGETMQIIAPPVLQPVTEWDTKYWEQIKRDCAKHGCSMRMDMVRVGMGVADLRFRPQWPKWEVKLLVDYNATYITAEQIANLFNVAGYSIGVGEWRPEKNGSHGRFHVE